MCVVREAETGEQSDVVVKVVVDADGGRECSADFWSFIASKGARRLNIVVGCGCAGCCCCLHGYADAQSDPKADGVTA